MSSSNSRSSTPTPANISLFSVSFKSPDKIHVAGANPKVLRIVRENIKQHYGDVQSETIKNSRTRFQLKDRPFFHLKRVVDKSRVELFVTTLLKNLLKNGWHLVLNSDLNQSSSSCKSTLFFQNLPTESYKKAEVCCLKTDFNGLKLLYAPPELVNALRESIGKELGKECSCSKVYFAKLKKRALHPLTHDKASFKKVSCSYVLLLKIFTNFRAQGFAFYGTANLKGNADCIFFVNNGFYLSPENYSLMAVNPNDALRLVNCPKETSDALSAAVEGKWTRRSWLASGGMECLELKLKAAPGNERSKGRSLMLEILEESARNGLSVLTSLAMSISSSDRMLLVMRSSSAASIFHLFVGLSGSNKIRLSGGDEEFRNSMKKVIEDNWISGLLPYLKLRRDECKLALKGTPWGSRFAHPHSSRSMMTKVLAKLQNDGFTVLCSADLPSKWISYGASASTNVHTWIVAKSGSCHTIVAYDSCAMESEMGNI